MGRIVIILLGITVSLWCLGCSTSSIPPEQYDARASLRSDGGSNRAIVGGIGVSQQKLDRAKEELSPEIRADVLKAIRGYMMQVGRYPRHAVQSSELLSLTSAQVANAPADSAWSYRALVRVSPNMYAAQTIEFSVFERSGQVIVRKVSI